jgi:hypothetical protein
MRGKAAVEPLSARRILAIAILCGVFSVLAFAAVDGGFPRYSALGWATVVAGWFVIAFGFFWLQRKFGAQHRAGDT